MQLRLGFAAVLVLIASAAASAVELPLVVDKLVTGPNAHVQLTNTGSQTVTAWSLATTTHTADGRIHRDVETMDGYLSEATEGLPGSSARLDRLLPGQSREIALDTLPSDATVQVVAVVLDDGTAIGDEREIAAIFERRMKERDALRAVVDTFNDVLLSKRRGAALEALQERLQVLVERDRSVPCRAALDAVEAYQRSAAAGNPNDVDQSLRMYVAFVTHEYELATKHSQRRKLS